LVHITITIPLGPPRVIPLLSSIQYVSAHVSLSVILFILIHAMSGVDRTDLTSPIKTVEASN